MEGIQHSISGVTYDHSSGFVVKCGFSIEQSPSGVMMKPVRRTVTWTSNGAVKLICGLIQLPREFFGSQLLRPPPPGHDQMNVTVPPVIASPSSVTSCP